MIKSIFNLIHQTGAVSKRIVAMLLLLTLLVTLTLADSRPAAAQGPDNAVYLPLIAVSESDSSPTGLYARMLQMAQQRCAATGLNQVCYVNGQVTLQPKTGAIPFTQPGALANLSDVQSFSLVSNGTDFQTWGIAWLRLRPDAGTPNQELTILAFGNVQVSNIIPFEGQAGPAGAAVLPSLQFASSPVAGVTQWGSSGLIVTNPADEEILSLTLNGAGIALGSTAFFEAQPGAKMTATMMTGSSLTEVNGQTSTAIQSQQVSVPLGQNGQASGPPTPAVATSPEPEPIDESLIPLPPGPSYSDKVLAKLNRAIDRCIAGRTDYVYTVLYRIHVIETTPFVKLLIDPAKLAQAYSRAAKCLSFELEFDSNVNSFTGPLSRSSHVRTTEMPIQFLVNGTFIALNKSLDYLNFVFIPPASPCTQSKSTTPGELEMAAGSLKIAVNQVKISMSLRVVKEAKDMGMLHCPHVSPLEWPDNWWIFFFDTHKGLLEGQDFRTFRFNDWKYTANTSQCSEPSLAQACNHFGEAIYEFTGEAEATTYNAATHLILLHTPEK